MSKPIGSEVVEETIHNIMHINDTSPNVGDTLLNEYQKLAMRTAPEFHGRKIGPIADYLIHASLGISTEIAELVEDRNNTSNVIQEIGDVCWYLSLFCSGLGLEMGELAPLIREDVNMGGLSVYDFMCSRSGYLCDQVKRHVYYSTNSNTVEIDVDSCKLAIADILSCLDLLSHGNMDMCMNKNILKLLRRYPDRFSATRAVSRDVNAEGAVFQ